MEFPADSVNQHKAKRKSFKPFAEEVVDAGDEHPPFGDAVKLRGGLIVSEHDPRTGRGPTLNLLSPMAFFLGPALEPLGADSFLRFLLITPLKFGTDAEVIWDITRCSSTSILTIICFGFGAVIFRSRGRQTATKSGSGSGLTPGKVTISSEGDDAVDTGLSISLDMCSELLEMPSELR